MPETRTRTRPVLQPNSLFHMRALLVESRIFYHRQFASKY